MEIPTQCDVVIVGAGLAGASAAYHLSQQGASRVIVLERGRVGEGFTAKAFSVSSSAVTGKDETELPWARASGTAVMREASTIKMMTQLFASDSESFIHHHGREGVSKYLRISNAGLTIEKDLAGKLLSDPATQLRNLGALYLARDEISVGELKHEFDLLSELGGQGLQWFTRDNLEAVPGCPADALAAIYLPTDAIINSQEFSKSLLQAAVATGAVTLFENCPEITNVSDSGGVALTELSNGARIVSNHVVVATGGFSITKELSGLIRPCWSYLSAVPHPHLIANPEAPATEATEATEGELLPDGTPYFSMNMYTWGFTHDWCWTKGAVRCSGEDHFSALKPPRKVERCDSLAQWVKDAYPVAFGDVSREELQFSGQYGVYSETPDSVPIIGHTNKGSRICYLVGCNAWGQTVLSYCATLVPALLGYTALDAQQKDALSLVTIRRFALLPSVSDGNSL